ncbi:MAG TPA: NADH-quinone oxidoreductase subunit M [Nitrospiria bacterium]|nr:NADH-quinone oxidoreductase subunit M [Nitrospiria bacterium]
MGAWLTLVIFLPAIGAVVLLAARGPEAAKRGALVVTVADLLCSLPLWWAFDRTTATMQFVLEAAWIPRFDIFYRVGVDGISLPLMLLTTLLMPVCVLCSWRAIDRRVKEFLVSLLLMETAMLGVFAALDFVLFYVFWEAMLIPMYLIIGVWGGANRLYAAIKFFLYTLAGSLLLLVALIALYFAGGRTFDIMKLMEASYDASFQTWIFWAFFLAFAIKVPMFPFHTWLPDAHVEAPTAGSVILASVLLKMGAYGFLRFCLPMTPHASLHYMPFILTVSVVAILYGAYMALAQEDLKKLIAYSSVSHMGFVTLGIFVFNVQGVEGALLQMINHGVTTGALFLCVGLLYERTHSRMIGDYGGVARPMPVFAACVVIFALSSLGLPGTNSFVGEFLVLVGAFLSAPVVAALAALGIILAAVYLLWMVQRVVWGEARPSLERLPDLSWREAVTLVPLVGLVFWIGLYPGPLLAVMHQSVEHVVAQAVRDSLPGGGHQLVQWIAGRGTGP